MVVQRSPDVPGFRFFFTNKQTPESGKKWGSNMEYLGWFNPSISCWLLEGIWRLRTSWCVPSFGCRDLVIRAWKIDYWIHHDSPRWTTADFSPIAVLGKARWIAAAIEKQLNTYFKMLKSQKSRAPKYERLRFCLSNWSDNYLMTWARERFKPRLFLLTSTFLTILAPTCRAHLAPCILSGWGVEERVNLHALEWKVKRANSYHITLSM